MKKVLWAAISGIFSVQPLFAGNGTTSLNFLQENLSARDAGMGGLSSVYSEGAEAAQGNPAGIALAKRPEVSASYVSTDDQSRHIFFSYAHPLVFKSFSLVAAPAVSQYDAGNIDLNDLAGNTRSLKAETGLSASMGLALQVRDFIYLGAAPKYVRSILVEQYSSNAWALDLGVLAVPFGKLLHERLRLGAAFRNYGPQVSYLTDKMDIPRTEMFGASIRAFDSEDYGSVMAAVEGSHVLREKIRTSAGLEYAYARRESRALFLRAGVRFKSESRDFSFGLGFREKNLEFNYAFINGADLEKVHLLGLTYRFGTLPDRSARENDLIDVEKEKSATWATEDKDMNGEKANEELINKGKHKGQEDYYMIERLEKIESQTKE